jgi:hypothetical protein
MNYQEWIEQFGSLTPWDAWRAGVESAAQVIDGYLSAYPENVFFPPPSPGQHCSTVDGCSAAALRAVLPEMKKDIMKLAEGSSMNRRKKRV